MSDESDIAVVGMAGRFPGAPNIEAYWDNLCSGVESIRFFERQELLDSGVPASLVDHPNYVPAAPVLDDIAVFDAEFFGYSAREAAAMDPQQRIFLESCWHALEHAGYDPLGIEGRVGVFGSSAMNTYLLFAGLIRDFQQDYLPTLIGNDKDFLATRVAFKLGLRGPAMSIQTACSSSLVAVHTACQALLSDEVDLCLAGGVAVRVPHFAGHLFEKGNVLSEDGHVRPFAAGATGTIFGSGAGIVALKRREDAEADGDTLYALIRGSAVNNDGAGKVGYTAPSVGAQAEVVGEALGVAGLSADTIGYVEGHGTGTQLGDPIEVAALTRAFRADTERMGFCGLGSVKANIGHLDAAAGIAGMIKAVMALERGEIPPTLNFDEANPEIDFAKSPFYVVAARKSWERENGQPRRAGVTSLGIGGTNAHILLEEAPSPETPGVDTGQQLLLLSARSRRALERNRDNLASFLADARVARADIAHTLYRGRHHFAERGAVVVAQSENADSLKTRFRRERAAPDRSAVFLFSGQGAQYPGMGRALYEACTPYREAVDRCADRLASPLGLDLRELLCADPSDEGAADKLRDTRLTQPALFTVSYALAAQWESVGVRPTAMAGHSVGEFVAAALSGVFSLEEALSLVALRGDLMASMPTGEMLAVGLSEGELLPLLPSELDVAVVNETGQTVVAGEAEAIRAFTEELEANGTIATALRTSHAFHSRMMEPVLERFEAAVADIGPRAPELPFTSCASGGWIANEEATDPAYWARHIRATVRFADCLRTLLSVDPQPAAIEVGPGQTLAAFARRHPSREGAPVFASLPPAREAGKDERVWLEAAGRFWASGGEIELDSLIPVGRRVAVPPYAFEPTPHWHEAEESKGPVGQAASVVKRSDRPEDWFYARAWTRLPPLSAPLQRSGESWLLASVGGRIPSGLADTARKQGVSVEVLDLAASEEPHSTLQDWARRAGNKRLLIFVGGGEGGDAERMTACHQRILSPLYQLAGALARIDASDPIEVVAVLEACQRVHGADQLRPEVAVALGPLRVLPKELDGISVRTIDVSEEVEIRQLLFEVLVEGRVPSVALRGGERWSPSFVPTSLPDSGGLPSQGVVLVTGASGGVGRQIVAALVASGARAIAMSRSVTSEEVPGVPPEKALAVRGDVSAASDVSAALEFARERFGPVTAIVHAAGVFAPALLAAGEPEESRDVLAPKTAGAHHLLEAAKRNGVEGLYFLSSINAFFPPEGSAVYAAGNAVLDALAEAADAPGTKPRVRSIAYPAWREAGMAARMEDTPAKDRFLERGLDPVEGLVALTAAMASPSPHLIVSPVDIVALEREWRGEVALRVGDAPVAAGAPLDADASLEDHVCRIWEEVLGAPPEASDDWVELGGTSYLAVRVFSKIEARLGVALPIDTLIEARSPRALAEVLEAAGARVSGPSEAPNAPAAGRCLVTLREGGEGPPLFIPHAHLGTVLGQVNLARALRDGRPVYGFRSAALDGVHAPDSTIPEMARRYVAELNERYPTGPFYLFGWCLGGTICLEMARQLRAQGRTPGVVIAAQPPARDFPVYAGALAKPKESLASLIVLAGREIQRLRAADAKASRARLRYLLVESWRRLGRRLGLETSPVGISERVAEANEHAFWEYEPEPYEGALAVIRSRREPLFAEEDASLGWEGLSAASLSLHEIDAYRDLMLEPPWVDDLARVVDEILDGHAGDEGQSSQSGDGSP